MRQLAGHGTTADSRMAFALVAYSPEAFDSQCRLSQLVVVESLAARDKRPPPQILFRRRRRAARLSLQSFAHPQRGQRAHLAAHWLATWRACPFLKGPGSLRSFRPAWLPLSRPAETLDSPSSQTADCSYP